MPHAATSRDYPESALAGFPSPSRAPARPPLPIHGPVGMTQTIHATQKLACTPEQFWEMYFDPAFTERLVATLDLKDLRELDFVDHEDRWVRTMWVEPNRDLPAAVRKVAKDATAETERGREGCHQDRSQTE